MRNPSCPNSPSILNSPNQTLSDSLDKRLLGYMAAAGAAGVGMLAMTQSADAKVVYTAANRSITSGSRLDLNNDNIPDYAFHGPFAICGTCSYMNVFALKFNKFMSSAHPLAAGISVGPGGKFSGREDQMTNFCTCSGHSAAGGPWLGIQNEYMGFEFNIKGAAHFGWPRFSVTDQGAITLTGYAYETVSLKPIVTGDTENDDQESMDQQEPAAATTQSSSLGRLALGAR
jgi:hypothetical protein